MTRPLRIGFGYDVHRLVPDRRLVLGGVEIPYEKGLLGHSDADVLLHAICDALLGAAALGDIGQRFPDTDPRYANANSLELLEEVGDAVRAQGYRIVNIDAMLVLQAPKIAPYLLQMRHNIARALRLALHEVSIKATTNEGLGFVGQGEGVVAYALAAIEER
ncbi:MAG: 2-C-methyl-D-erythritol 2,4-cyclodiphosphate synthase [Bacteroidetes bacterium]|nr:2-C-methyl-D-erythritol 2,4-cyclodiphosphate synthase [Rhodothermia bacterium]MCS7155805.1 2-C-methyl-D-erythritol 2,4-cyclodiphosphate synthase [Bacteroidota bacterium]MCX7906094.1 2-C-methyl-D-erythritol 2,4-cyclodiphosphate synthase [Bacteroidota bacterium]MDW8138222.1 2-C-methyl-D-erythritol 2,4-cyclodiphosphate synthase [Bacteroidota bacterium]MDW8285906.1 2-C-methyl-D-erythritol 2,4-cyclodiphosphate synthase [Bacteroidota bacterium]